MRPYPPLWLLLLLAATNAVTAVADDSKTTVSKSSHSSLPFATLFFPNGGNQIRSMEGAEGQTDVGQAVPWLASLARSFPTSFRSFDRQPIQSREAVSAIEEFTGPLVRFATGGQPVAADVEQLIDSIPHLTRSANVLKEADKVNLSSLDITSLPSNVLSHVLNGGEIPGIDHSELERVVREHLKRMSETADKVLKGEHVDNIEKILLPLEKVPMEMVMNSLQGKMLPGLTTAETGKIREYYTKQLPSHAPADADTASPLPETLAAIGGMVQLLPPGYDIGRIPPEFIQSILEGRVPDLSLLPPDLQAYLSAGRDQAISLVKSLNSSLTEIVHHLAATVQKIPEVNKAAVYDIAQVTHEVVDVEANKGKQNRNVLYTVAWVTFAFAITAVVCIWLLYRKFSKPCRKAPPSAVTPPARDSDDLPLALPEDESPRRRHVASIDRSEKIEFESKACRFSTPKLQLVLNTPDVDKKEKKAFDFIDKNTNDANAIFDVSQSTK